MSFEDEESSLDLRGQGLYPGEAPNALKIEIMMERYSWCHSTSRAALKETFQRHLDLGIETLVLTPDEWTSFIVVTSSCRRPSGRTGESLVEPDSDPKNDVFTDDKARIHQALTLQQPPKMAVARGAGVESVLGRLR